MKIVAFGHRRRMGKDTVAGFALSHMRFENKEFSCQRIGFADPLKEESYRMFKWAGLQPGIYYENHPEFKEQILPAIGKSPRDIWIEVGEAMRKISPKIWPEMTLSKSDCDMLFVSDLRHRSELHYVEMTEGFAIKIIRPGIDESADVVDCSLADYDNWDGVIINNGTLKDLNDATKIVISEILKNSRKWVIDAQKHELIIPVGNFLERGNLNVR